MTAADLEVLARAHALFGGVGPAVAPVAVSGAPPDLDRGGGLQVDRYRGAAHAWRGELSDAGRIDAEIARIMADARQDRADGRARTAAVLAAARADNPMLDNPVAAREYLRRSALRLRAQRGHVLAARRSSRRHRAALLRLRYLLRTRRGRGRPRSARADRAVRAALSRLGRPYVWGATGPDRFDCSGLVKWAYAQAGVPLHRTTYDQINQGIAVAPADVRPGDLVFPHAGHVQLAIGNGLVVEAPYAGANVQISPLGPSIAIRRPG